RLADPQAVPDRRPGDPAAEQGSEGDLVRSPDPCPGADAEMTDQITVVHLSDTHIAPPGEIAYDTDTAENLRSVARRVREMALDPACFIVSGDLSNHGEPESYQHLARIVDEEFRPFGVPVLLGLGNHDSRLPFRRIVLGQTEATDERKPYYSSTVVR